MGPNGIEGRQQEVCQGRLVGFVVGALGWGKGRPRVNLLQFAAEFGPARLRQGKVGVEGDAAAQVELHGIAGRNQVERLDDLAGKNRAAEDR